MNLTDLEPRWLTFDGRRVGFIFRCPTGGGSRGWQTCFVEQFPSMSGSRPPLDEWCTPDSQTGIVAACCPELEPQDVQLCNKACAWSVAGGIENATFEAMTVTPSLDGSAAGNWHGFITNGEIVGGI